MRFIELTRYDGQRFLVNVMKIEMLIKRDGGQASLMMEGMSPQIDVEESADEITALIRTAQEI